MREYTAATEPAAAADDGETARRAAAFAELYRTRNRQLVAYATSLADDALTAEDLVAQAHFRVWRQLRAGQEFENVPAHLTTTLRNLATGPDRAPGDIDAAAADHAAGRGAGTQDPEQYARQVALLARRIKQLPDRWVGALWHADVEELPMQAIGTRIGADEGAAAVVVAHARERLRETFLRAQPGTASEACAEYWELMPSIVHGTATARKTRQFGHHAKKCKECGARLAQLTEADSQFPVLLGPALLAAVFGGESRLLPAISGTTAGARAPRTGARHARVKPVAASRAGRPSAKPKVLLSSVGIVSVAAAATALALGATESHHAAAAAAITAPSDAPTQAAPGTAAGSSLPAQATAATTGVGTTPLGTLLTQATQAATKATQAATAAASSGSTSSSSSSSNPTSGTGATGSETATAPAGSGTTSSPPSTSSSPTTPPSSPSGGASGSSSATPPPSTTPSSPASPPTSPPATTSAPTSSPSESDTSSGTSSPSISPSGASSSAAAQDSATTTESATS